MNNMQVSQSVNRIVWADVIRFIAIFMVIAIHCTDPFNVSPEARSNPDFNFWGGIYGSLLRPCVPLFVMLTGMLLLPIHQPMGSFYKKRMLRVIVPFLIWSVLYNLFPWFTGVMGWSPEVLTNMFAYAGQTPSQSFTDSLHNIVMIPFNFSVYTIPMWYIFMLIGLYLYMPVFSAWVKQASDKQKRLFLAVWIVTLFLPYANVYISGQILGVCSWNGFGTLYYFAGFNGYLLLGHYLSRGNNWSLIKTLLIALVLFATGYAITYTGFKNITSQPNITEEQMELFFLYCSPNVFLMTLAVFLVAQKIRIKSPLALSAFSNITKCGLGIYMIHYFVVGVGYAVVDAMQVPIFVRIPLTSILVFVVSWGITASVYKIVPKTARWIMG